MSICLVTTGKMTKVTNNAVHLCTKFHHIAATILCILLFTLQAGLLDLYLIKFISNTYFFWVGIDIFVMIILVVSIIFGYTRMHNQRTADQGQRHMMFSTSWVAWLFININSSIKMILIIKRNAWPAESDPSFFGPNVFKTAIALSSCIFLFLLTTQHDAPLGSDRRNYISDLTGTVVFDILDTVDILEVFFTKEDRESLWPGLEVFIVTEASMNLILPTVPLVTLSLTQFGLEKPKRHMIYLHRLLVVLVVNCPNLLTRLILWHGLSVGISPFTLKNIILIGMTLYEFYEHKREKLELQRSDIIVLEDSINQVKNDFATVGQFNISSDKCCQSQQTDEETIPHNNICHCVPKVSVL